MRDMKVDEFFSQSDTVILLRNCRHNKLFRVALGVSELYQVLLILSALEQSELNVSLAFTTASLYWMFLKTQGTDVKTHKIKDEIVRLAAALVIITVASMNYTRYILRTGSSLTWRESRRPRNRRMRRVVLWDRGRP